MRDGAKRLTDVILALAGLIVTSPVLVMAMVWISAEDGHSPLYIAPRIGRDGRPFHMLKLRSMIWDAHRHPWDSTRADDPRITRSGRFVRRYKIDEIPQLWNVIRGDMSLVGPRPNVQRETDLYTAFERRLLEVRPGVTDFSSIVFADLSEILKGHRDPNVGYRQLVRPGKSQLGVFYIEHRTFFVDVQVILLTVLAIVSRKRALAGVQRLLARLGASPELVALAGREQPLVPA
jgi:lipopolysaccharide/colanic/teichoic acid biosynthesis glycosyltransferase